jgi:hypothetical protein
LLRASQVNVCVPLDFAVVWAFGVESSFTLIVNL